MSETRPKAPRWTLWLPLALFFGFVALVTAGLLRPKDNDINSQMIGKPLPTFALKAAADGREGLSSSDFTGKPRLLNIFASWCVPCGVEAPVLAELKRQGAVIEGIAIRDHKDELNAFLARNGNPFDRIGADEVSQVQLDIGSSGVPETFIIDAKGVIRYQHIGDIRPEEVPTIMAKLKDAES